MQRELTTGPVTKTILLFAVPMILGNLLQQAYNIADTLIVGRYLGAGALAAVGSAYTLMTFLCSILIGLCMGSGIVFSMYFGSGETDRLKKSIFTSFLAVGVFALFVNIAMFFLLDPIMLFLRIPAEIYAMTREYLRIVFFGFFAGFLYNYAAALLRATGNSVTPLLFLAFSAVLNIVLDLLFVVSFHRGVGGAAFATVLSQYVSGIGIFCYIFVKEKWLKPKKEHMMFDIPITKEILQFSSLTCLQQSVMNFGILMVQGLVNSFGTSVMAAFAAAVKIDSFAYMPVQDFGNAFSTFVAQNYGAGKEARIREGIRKAGLMVLCFCLLITLFVTGFAEPLMRIFISPEETEIIETGVQYLRIEGSFYFGIGCLFLLYGYFRAVGRPGMSVVLTVISLGTRVVLAHLLSAVPVFGVRGIWWSVPVGWILADLFGLCVYQKRKVI